jgi:hypothetical protein
MSRTIRGNTYPQAFIPLWLRDVYFIISKSKVKKDPDHDLFGLIAGNRITDELIGKNNRNKRITLFVPGLRGIYWQYRNRLSVQDQEQLDITMDRADLEILDDITYTPGFPPKIVESYLARGPLTKYDVLTISVKDFIQHFNKSLPLRLELDHTNVIVQISYKPYDFWDPERQEVISYIKP